MRNGIEQNYCWYDENEDANQAENEVDNHGCHDKLGAYGPVGFDEKEEADATGGHVECVEEETHVDERGYVAAWTRLCDCATRGYECDQKCVQGQKSGNGQK